MLLNAIVAMAILVAVPAGAQDSRCQTPPFSGASDAGANPRAVSDLGWNAFHAAIDVDGADANSEESIRSTFEFLLLLGVDINHKDARGVTPLERARKFVVRAEVDVLRQLGAK